MKLNPVRENSSVEVSDTTERTCSEHRFVMQSNEEKIEGREEEEQAEEQEEQGRGQRAQISPLVTNWVIFSRPLQCLA